MQTAQIIRSECTWSATRAEVAERNEAGVGLDADAKGEIKPGSRNGFE